MRLIAFLTIAFAATAWVSAASATTIVANVVDDRTFDDINGDGIADQMQPVNDWAVSAFLENSTNWRAAAEFDLSALPANATVSNASFSIRQAGTTAAGDVLIYGYTGNGVVELSDALNTGFLAGTLTVASSPKVQDLSADVTAFIQSQAGQSFVGLLFVSGDESDFRVGGLDACSSEGAAGTGTFSRPECLGIPPQITITFDAAQNGSVSAPAVAFPMLAAFATIVARKKSQKQR